MPGRYSPETSHRGLRVPGRPIVLPVVLVYSCAIQATGGTIMPIRRFLILLLSVLLSFSSAFAQTATGVITGSVLDSSRAIAAGAKVTLLNQETNQRREVTANAAGVYEFRALPNGL